MEEELTISQQEHAAASKAANILRKKLEDECEKHHRNQLALLECNIRKQACKADFHNAWAIYKRETFPEEKPIISSELKQ